ncbi:MAG: LamG domain-containing protein [Chromatiales bacterium]|nr:LamG domain-containing protein [Chromatiales bacterium]
MESRLKALLQTTAVAVAASVLVACGGGASTERLPPNNVTPPSSYTGPPPQTADILNFMNALWTNVRNGGVARCAGCHGTTQTPLFARDDDVNLAWAAADQLVNRTDPGMSTIVQKMAGGHNCWLGSNQPAIQACATTMQTWVENWVSGTASGGTKTIQLVAPPLKNVGQSRNFPADSAGFAATVYPLVREYCAGCHSSTSATQQSPFFADEDVATAYAAVKTKINLDSPASSRLVLRLRNEFHNCWNNCTANAQEMEDAIRAYAQQIPVTAVDQSLVISKALTMYDGTVASGGSRYEAGQIALWEFKEGSGSTAFDTSGVQPAINLTLSGDIAWVGGWGINIRSGRAQGSTTASRKLRNLITATGQFTIEAWAAPANVNQEDARIVTYSAGPTLRNFTMGQTLYSYDFFNRSSNSDANGSPLLQTLDDDEDAQATLQHVVMTYDPVAGRRIYVNGVYTEDQDPAAGGTLGDWDDTFALVLGNEPSGNRQWQGVLRMAAIHNRALTPAQVQQNYDAGVGEKFFLLFDVSTHSGAAGSYVLFEVSQFDSYSYLFNRPTFISLDPDWSPSAPIPIRGLRIGANGVVVPISQAYRNLDEAVSVADGYAPETGQVLSSLGTVMPLEKGPDQDEFFLTFEVFGNSTNVVTEPAPLVPPPPSDSAPVSDIGVKTFDEINATMATITGVSPNQPAVKATYALVRQQLPAVVDLNAVLASHQVGIAQLAIEYCNALVEDNTLRTNLWGGFNFSAPASTAFDTGPERDQIFVPLLTKAMNTNVMSQPDEAAVRMELDNLTTDLASCGGSCAANRTRTIVKAACAATIGSAVTLVQ